MCPPYSVFLPVYENEWKRDPAKDTWRSNKIVVIVHSLELIASDSISDECVFDAHTLILIHLFPTNYYLLLNANIC